jgi:hypothetical protein
MARERRDGTGAIAPPTGRRRCDGPVPSQRCHASTPAHVGDVWARSFARAVTAVAGMSDPRPPRARVTRSGRTVGVSNASGARLTCFPGRPAASGLTIDVSREGRCPRPSRVRTRIHAGPEARARCAAEMTGARARHRRGLGTSVDHHREEKELDTAVTFACEQRLHGPLVGLLERDVDTGEYRVEGRAGGSPAVLAALTGELVVGGVVSVIRANMLDEGAGRLVELAPALMAFIGAPHLGRAAAQAELEGRPSGAGEATANDAGPARVQAVSHAAELPVRATHRTTLVLRAIARAPCSTNREVAQAAGLADEGQTSKMLARLERRGVIENVGLGPARGEPNAWVLTVWGRRTVELINDSFASGGHRPRRRADERGIVMPVRARKSFSVLGRTRRAASTVESRHRRGRLAKGGIRAVLPASTRDRLRGVAELGARGVGRW